MKYRIRLKFRGVIRDIIVEAESEAAATKQAEYKIKQGEQISSIKPLTSSQSKSGSWWEIWLD